MLLAVHEAASMRQPVTGSSVLTLESSLSRAKTKTILESSSFLYQEWGMGSRINKLQIRNPSLPLFRQFRQHNLSYLNLPCVLQFASLAFLWLPGDSDDFQIPPSLSKQFVTHAVTAGSRCWLSNFQGTCRRPLNALASHYSLSLPPLVL